MSKLSLFLSILTIFATALNVSVESYGMATMSAGFFILNLVDDIIGAIESTKNEQKQIPSGSST